MIMNIEDCKFVMAILLTVNICVLGFGLIHATMWILDNERFYTYKFPCSFRRNPEVLSEDDNI